MLTFIKQIIWESIATSKPLIFFDPPHPLDLSILYLLEIYYPRQNTQTLATTN